MFSELWLPRITDYYIPELIPLYFTIRGNRAVILWTDQFNRTAANPQRALTHDDASQWWASKTKAIDPLL